MKTTSNKRLTVLRESIGKTVRMFTQEGIQVTQRGMQPFVLWNSTTGKADRINMPMIPDNAELELLEALQGFLDHECAHVFFTDAKRQIEIARMGKKSMLPMMNLVEDIRIEKLIVRRFPGTGANLARMRSGAFGTILKNICEKAKHAPQPQCAMSMMVPAFRALAGQPEMQQLMDEGGYWPFVAPLVAKLPGLAKRLQDMETYEEVIEISQWIFDTLGKPKMAPTPFEEPPEPQTSVEADESEPTDDGESQADDTPQEDDDTPQEDDDTPQEDKGESEPEADGDEEGDEPGDGEDGDEGGEQQEDDKSDGEGGEGNPDGAEDDDADGEGTPDGGDGDGEDGDEEPGDTGSGDAEGESDDSDSDEDGDGDGKGEDDGEDHEGGEPTDEEAEPGEGATGKGKSKHSVTEAMKKLSSTHRQVLYMYNKKRLDVAAIADKMRMSEEDVQVNLREARRNLGRLMQEPKP